MIKRMIQILTALASLTIANLAHAQIGWTLDQCKAKWGDPKEGFQNLALFKLNTIDLTEAKTVGFSTENYSVVVMFSSEGKVYLACYEATNESGDLKVPESDEINSWHDWASHLELMADGYKISKPYNGISWKMKDSKDEDAAFVEDVYYIGYRNKKPAFTLESGKVGDYDREYCILKAI